MSAAALIRDDEPANRQVLRTAILRAGGLLWCAILAFAWPFETPDKAVTVMLAVFVFAAAATLIRWAARSGIIESEHLWIWVFLAKITISFAIVTFLWAAPLIPNGMLRTETQIGIVTDSNFYDYMAEQIARGGFRDNLSLLNSTWQSVGILAYASAIYALFGISILHVTLVNALMVLVMALALAGTLRALDGTGHPWDGCCWAMLLPFGAYYDAMISKEPVTNALFYLALFLLARYVTNRGSHRVNLTLVGILVALLGAVRPNAALVLFIVPVPSLIRLRRVGRVVILSIVGVAILGAAAVGASGLQMTLELLSLQRRTEVYAGILESRESDGGDGGVKEGISRVFAPDDPLKLIALAPVRVVIWTYVPYPLVIPNVSAIVEGSNAIARDWNAYFRQWQEVFRVSSSWLLILLTPALIASALDRRSRMRPGYFFLATALLVPLLIISNAMFLMGSRYRILIEPLMLAVALWGIRFADWRRYALPAYGSFVSVLVLFNTYLAWR